MGSRASHDVRRLGIAHFLSSDICGSERASADWLTGHEVTGRDASWHELHRRTDGVTHGQSNQRASKSVDMVAIVCAHAAPNGS
jgi:hypothetical protein